VRTILKGWSAKSHWAGSVEGDYAIDWYAAPLGTPAGWINGGHTRGTAQAGPLFLPAEGHDCFTPGLEIIAPEHFAVQDNDGVLLKMCHFGEEDWRPLPKDHVFIPQGYSLYTCILDCDDGQTMIGLTHVLREAKLDVDVKPHEPFFKVGDSGLEPFTQRGQNPCHIHFAVMVDPAQFKRWQGGKGNIKPWYWLQSKGFQIREEATVPSPQMYVNGYVNNKPY
jgi:hypothetical protein